MHDYGGDIPWGRIVGARTAEVQNQSTNDPESRALFLLLRSQLPYGRV